MCQLLGACAALTIVSNVQGMQRNPPHKTIESDLQTALYRAGAIDSDSGDEFFKVMSSNSLVLERLGSITIL